MTRDRIGGVCGGGQRVAKTVHQRLNTAHPTRLCLPEKSGLRIHMLQV